MLTKETKIEYGFPFSQKFNSKLEYTKKKKLKKCMFNPPSKLPKIAILADFCVFFFWFFGLREGQISKF